MTAEARRSRRLWGFSLLHWSMLFGSLTLTAVAWKISTDWMVGAAQTRFRFQSADLVTAIEARMSAYESVLTGGVGLFLVVGEVSQQGWATYVDNLHLESKYAGIQGVGFTRLLRPDEVAAHEAAVRATGYPDYRVWPEGEREVYTAIVFLEPFDRRNRRAFGYDMFSEPNRRRAMEHARDSGEAATSEMVTLVQEDGEDVQKGFLVYLPLYAGGAPTETVEQRRAALQGYVYAAFRIGDLMHGILGNQEREISFEIFDGAQPSQETLLYDEDPSELHLVRETSLRQFQSVTPLHTGGHTWTIVSYSRDGYISDVEALQPLVVAVGGGIVDLLLFLVIGGLARQRRAEREVTQAVRDELRVQTGTIESVPVGIVVTEGNPSTQPIVYANAAYLAITGCSVDEVLGREGIYLDDGEAGLLYEELLAGRPARTTQRRQERDGQEMWTELSISGLRDETGRITHVACIVHDITERVRNEAALALAYKRAQTIFDSVFDAIITIDRRGIIQAVNASALVLFDYPSEELVGKNVSTLMPEPHRSQHDGYLERYFRTGEARILGSGRQVEGRKRDGSIFPLDLAVTEVQLEDQQIFIGIVRDITERQKMDRIQREFVAVVSHELRTPLTSIRGALGLMAGGVMGPLPEETEALVEVAHRNSEQLTRLVDDLLDMDRIATGQMRMDLRPVELGRIVLDTVDRIWGFADSLEVSFRVQSEPGEIVVMADEGRLGQVLTNLLSNAAKFSSAGATVEIVIGRNGDWARVSVRDQGAGVPQEFWGRLFDRFTQADSSDSRGVEGTGLGLAISKELVERMGGLIAFEPQAGGGSCFFFQLPIRTELS